jgi:hypothetical protein
MSDRLALPLALAASLLAAEARAGCCNVVKTSASPPEVTLRVCEIAPTGACASVLWEGTLATGASVNVCSPGDGIRYEVSDGAGGYGEPTGAVCDGSADVEI